ncbi:hypothetical protein BDR26DRAFT_855937 [Obelidium mucronatum]|nr:hypothetical protein BDR26DRAFT_855937 [Obelidium mucronatum]
MGLDNDLTQNPALQQTTVGFIGLFAGLLALGLVVFLGLLLATSDSLRHAFSYKNCLLLSLIICQCGYLGAHALYLWLPPSDKSPAIIITMSSFANFSMLFYIQTSWSRTSEILRETVSKLLFRFFQVVIMFASAMCLLPVISLSANNNKLYNITIAISGALTVLTDSIFAFAYYSFMFRKTADTVEIKGMDSRAVTMFGIISRHGVVTTLSTIAALVCSILLTMAILNHEGVKAYSSLLVLVDLFLFTAVLSLLSMKVKLILFRLSSKKR